MGEEGDKRNADARNAAIEAELVKLVECEVPDTLVEQNAKEKFAAINGAYEILSDPEKRQMFDAGAMDADGNQQVLITSDVPLRTFSLRTSYNLPNTRK